MPEPARLLESYRQQDLTAQINVAENEVGRECECVFAGSKSDLDILEFQRHWLHAIKTPQLLAQLGPTE